MGLFARIRRAEARFDSAVASLASAATRGRLSPEISTDEVEDITFIASKVETFTIGAVSLCCRGQYQSYPRCPHFVPCITKLSLRSPAFSCPGAASLKPSLGSAMCAHSSLSLFGDTVGILRRQLWRIDALKRRGERTFNHSMQDNSSRLWRGNE